MGAQVRVFDLPSSGHAQPRRTLHIMRDVAISGHTDPMVRQVAESIVRHLPPRDVPTQVEAIRKWLQAKFQFLRDPTSIEYTKTPRQMLEEVRDHGVVMGDCDDAAVLAAALGTVIGIAARFRALAFDGEFRHVIADLWTGQGWMDMDVTKPSQHLPPQASAMMVLNV